MAQDEEVKGIEISDALQDVLVMQPAVMVGLISMMTGSALQEDIAATTRALLSKGQDTRVANRINKKQFSECQNFCH